MLVRILKRLLGRRSGVGDERAAANRSSAEVEGLLSDALRQFEQQDLTQAEASAEQILRIDAHEHRAWNLLGALALRRGNAESAAHHFERAIALAPSNANYLSNCGEACRRAGWMDEAIEHCAAALACDATHAGAAHNLALALHATGEVERAYAVLMDALAVHSTNRALRSALLFLLGHHRDVDGARALTEHRHWDELHARELAPKTAPRMRAIPETCKLRVGYVSGDFRRHSVSYFFEPLLAQHDRTQFDIYCYSNVASGDDVTERLRGQVSHWRDISTLSDEAAAGQIANDGIDILVDLAGHTAGNRLLVFARKPAPVQIAYLGYLNTTGMGTMDYRITDAYADPPAVATVCYSEALLRMPHSQWCYRPPSPTPEVNPLPARDRGFITFGSVHSFAKFNRAMLAVWARILVGHPRSQLLIAGVPEGETGARLRAQMAAHGVDPTRIELVGKLDFDEYFRLYHRIDIGLDAFPYAGGTTTCESLWMGVPVVTLAGHYGMGRSGVSLLTCIGLRDLIAHTPERYVQLAIELASDTDTLAQLRGGLRQRMRESPLMDEIQFTRDFEALLQSAWQMGPASSMRQV